LEIRCLLYGQRLVLILGDIVDHPSRLKNDAFSGSDPVVAASAKFDELDEEFPEVTCCECNSKCDPVKSRIMIKRRHISLEV
jgi:hypothetical protein